MTSPTPDLASRIHISPAVLVGGLLLVLCALAVLIP